MVVRIDKERSEMWTSDRRLYLDKDGNVVEEGGAKTALLVGAGGTLPMERARELGLVATEEKAAAPKANKARTAAPENKSGE